MALSEADHVLVTAAIAAAEAQSDGEVVPIVAPRSDPYRDVALHWAVLAMLAVPAKLTLLPQDWIDRAAARLFGWNGEFTRETAMLALLVMLALAFLAMRLLLSNQRLLMALTPGATKSRRVRRRAVELFRASCEGKTRGRTGVVIYLSLLERRAEIVADEAIHSKVDQEVWGEAMAALVDEVKAGRIGTGMARAIERVGTLLAEHLPRSAADTNELPDRLIEL